MATAGEKITPSSLASVVQEELTAEWVDVTVNGGYASQGGAHDPQVRLIGSRVYMKGGVDSTGLTASTNETAVMTVPAGWEPVKPYYVMVASSAPDRAGRALIGSDGDIDLLLPSSVGSYYLFDGISWDVE